MPCRSPVKQYLTPDGAWVLSPESGISPRFNRDLPCGVCAECRVRRTTEWSIRCYHEAQMHERNCFVNPTFAVDPVTLSREPFRNFFKSLRNAGHKFSYFGCGEYGEHRSRPHGHIILFGLDFAHDRKPWKRIKGNLYYRSASLEKHWPHGHILFSDFTRKNAMYTAGYTMKKLNGPAAEDVNPETGLKHYERMLDGGEIREVMPEFTMASLKPAVGKRWFEKYYGELYQDDSVVMDGREYPVPRKYDEWLKATDPTLHQAVTEKRAQWAQQNRLALEERERIADARQNTRDKFLPERQ